MEKLKIVEIGPCPPPNSGWSVRIKYLKDSFTKRGYNCRMLNLGRHRKEKSDEYIDVQSGIDFVKKLIKLRLEGYDFHMHMNAQSVKGPILSLIALFISFCTFRQAALTFHGGINQLYFPKENGRKMYLIIYLNFLLSKVIICNNESIKKMIAGYGLFINKEKIYPIQAFSIQYMSYKEAALPTKLTEFIEKKSHIITCYVVLRKGFFIETLIEFLNRLDKGIGMVLTGIGEAEDIEVEDYLYQLRKLEEKGVIFVVDNLDHDQFMTLLSKSDMYLRTPVSDGVASSVLEALYLKVPVVASENVERPKSVITYNVKNVDDMYNKVHFVLNNLQTVKDKILKPDIRDTLKEEIDLLVRTFGRLEIY